MITNFSLVPQFTYLFVIYDKGLAYLEIIPIINI